jgi:rhamnose transport system ATP-binding protein
MPHPDPLLSAHDISKSFGAVQALTGVSLDVCAGVVHALVGENGAGKSTLIKVMTGEEVPDAGTLVAAGRRVSGLTPLVAHDLGIRVVHQQPSLFPDLTVAENLSLGVERTRPWQRVDWGTRRGRARELLFRVGAAIDPDRIAGSLTMPEQQLAEIARALGADARVLILDEPTASLTAPEVEALFDTLRRLRREDVGILYISHRLGEVLVIADRVTSLRDGRTVATRPVAGLSLGALGSMIARRHAGRGTAAGTGVQGYRTRNPRPHVSRRQDSQRVAHRVARGGARPDRPRRVRADTAGGNDLRHHARGRGRDPCQRKISRRALDPG